MIEQVIEEIYHRPYSLLRNNCFHKSIEIVQAARDMGKKANIVICWSVENERILKGLPPIILPHAYAEIEGKKVDVAYDPDTEKVLCANSERVTLLPIRLPRGKVNPLPGYREEDVRIEAEEPAALLTNILPTPPKEGPPLPRGLGVKWPGV